METAQLKIKKYLHAALAAYSCVSIFEKEDKESATYKLNKLHKDCLEEIEKKDCNNDKVNSILSDINKLLSNNTKICGKCSGVMIADDKVYMSNPPKFRYHCTKCTNSVFSKK